MSLRGKVEMAGVTHPGQVREHNEDHIVTDPDLGLLMVADGMGGQKAGEVASGMAVDLIARELRDTLSGADVGDVLGRAVKRANEIIHQVANSQPQCAGMGTTVVLLLFRDNRLSVAHVGDSRVYRLRGEELVQVTADHSLVQELVDRGFYTDDEARESANRNIVTRALGIAPNVEYDLQDAEVERGDVFLLCSDGLNDMVDDSVIREILLAHRTDLTAAAQALVDAANLAGGKDNVSVVLARVVKPFPARNNWLSRLKGWFD